MITVLSVHLSAQQLMDAIGEETPAARTNETHEEYRTRCALYMCLYGYKAFESLIQMRPRETLALWSRAQAWASEFRPRGTAWKVELPR